MAKVSRTGDWRCRLRFMLAAFTFFAANTFDYVLTAFGLNKNMFAEANPIIRPYLYLWGLNGLRFFKIALCVFIVLGIEVWHRACKEKNIKSRFIEFFKPERLLYGSAVLAALAGVLWRFWDYCS